MLTGWAPPYYAESFDTRDLATVFKVAEDRNRKRA